MLIVEDLRTKQRRWIASRTGPPGHYNFKPGEIIMKFGEELRTSVIKEYQWYYIAYDELKQALKTQWVTPPSKKDPKGKRRAWSEEDESKFIARLEQELDKVHTKQKVKAIEIGRRIAGSEKEVSDVVARLSEREDNGALRDPPSDEEFMMLEEDLSDIIADVHDLAKFVQLNYTGFQKIIKKHDVRLVGWEAGNLLTGTETNKVDAQARICDETKGQTILQRQLRCRYCQALKVV
jgi:SPX domain protein involved in polyphosphate accumulation